MSSLDHWARQLEAWSLPPEILDQAPESPYQYPRELFAFRDEQARLDAVRADDPSASRAREEIPEGGTVVDVGAGAGRAALALVPPAGRLVLVDEKAPLLEEGRRQGEEAGALVDAVVGRWPDVASVVPAGDVVVCHHVLYNVADLAPFLGALADHARRRVVIEITEAHPWVPVGPLFAHFWDLDRPTGPTADDAVAAVTETLDRPPHVERHVRPGRGLDPELAVVLARRRLCLSPDRDPEIAEVLERHPQPTTRDVVTLWWDTAP